RHTLRNDQVARRGRITGHGRMDRSDPDRHLTLHARVEGLHLLGLGYHLTDGFRRADIALVAHFGQDLLSRLQPRLELALLDEQFVHLRLRLFGQLRVRLDVLLGLFGVALQIVVDLLQVRLNLLVFLFNISHFIYSAKLKGDSIRGSAPTLATTASRGSLVASRAPSPDASRRLALYSEMSFLAALADMPEARRAASMRRTAEADAFSPFSAT